MDELREKAFSIFNSMKPGQVMVIADVAEKDPKKFVEYGKAFIDAGNHNYEFTAEYRAFRRMWHKIEDSQLEALEKPKQQELNQAA